MACTRKPLSFAELKGRGHTIVCPFHRDHQNWLFRLVKLGSLQDSVNPSTYSLICGNITMSRFVNTSSPHLCSLWHIIWNPSHISRSAQNLLKGSSMRSNYIRFYITHNQTNFVFYVRYVHYTSRTCPSLYSTPTPTFQPFSFSIHIS